MTNNLQNINIPTDPGNSFATAYNLGVLNSGLNWNESININPSGDLDDFYRLEIDSTTEVEIFVDVASEKLDVDLLRGPSFSNRVFLSSATPSSPLSRTVSLEPGVYYLKIFTFNLRSSEYQVTLNLEDQEPDNNSETILIHEDFADNFDITKDKNFELDGSFLPIPFDLRKGTALEDVVGTQLRVNDSFGRQLGLPTVVEVDDSDDGTALRLRLDTFNPSAINRGDSFFGTGIKTKDNFNRVSGGLAFEARVRLVDSNENPLSRGIISSVFSFTPNQSVRDEIDFEILSNFIEDARNNNSEPSIFTNVFDDDDLSQRGDFKSIDLGDFPALEGSDLTKFNTFRVEWFPDKILWKVNGIEIREETNTVPDEDMGIFLNIWANGFEEAFDDSLIPAKNLQSNETFFYDIDYVQVERLELFRHGTSGNDTIDGTAGNDTLDGQAGNDLLSGFAGNDMLLGGQNNDTLLGNQDNDTLYGGQQNDTLYGGQQNDTLFGDRDSDSLFGDRDNDTIYGGKSNDILFGGQQNDILFGDNDNDLLSGDLDNDTLFGGNGEDILTGGSGQDRFSFNSSDEGIDEIVDFSVVDDTIAVSAAGFGGGLVANAAIAEEQFIIGTEATTASHRFIYDSDNGALFFDQDGTGPLASVLITTLSSGLAMTNADIFVTA